jgi:hypothetical protein
MVTHQKWKRCFPQHKTKRANYAKQQVIKAINKKTLMGAALSFDKTAAEIKAFGKCKKNTEYDVFGKLNT